MENLKILKRNEEDIEKLRSRWMENIIVEK